MGCNWRAPLYRFYDQRLAGRKTFDYVDSLSESQWLSPDAVRELQWRELGALLRHAYEQVPFHRARFQELGITPQDLRTPEDYARLPLMEKRDFVRCQEELRARNHDPARLYSNGTGGSTGEPMRYLLDRNSYEWRQAAHLRGNMWAGSGLGRREFHLWGEPMRPGSRLSTLKRTAWHWALNHHYANSYRMSPETMAEYLSELNRRRPEVLIGYSYSLYLFARYIAETGAQVWAPRGIIGTAEKLLPHQRETIEAVFRAPIYELYGCREVMLIAMECEQHRGLHLTAENLYVEILRDGRPARPGEVGEVVVTDLHNHAMPFLRYRNGDLAVASDRTCACGRGLPLIEEVFGRTLDVLRTPDGRHISGVFVPMFFKDYPWVEEFQVEQDALDRVEVRLKPAAGYRPELLTPLQNDLQARLGPAVRLDFRIVDEIPRTASGKHRPVISRLPLEPLGEAYAVAGR
ncbi:MAG: capK2 [Armatimonadetes bacterium]|jgi:phenylacetate-CoA ligase|nr:capK2 [Armatimonadota bacterium]